jgi:hypothetical protein
VALFALKRPARRRVNPRVYASLRANLIAACQSLAAADDGNGGYYARLERMVRPWINLRALDRTDGEILFMLLEQCREVERELKGRRWRLEWPSRVGAVLPPARAGTGRRWRPEWRLRFGPALGVAVAAAVGLGLVWALQSQRVDLPGLDALRDAARTVWLTIKYSDQSLQWSVGGVLLIIAAIIVVSRSARA